MIKQVIIQKLKLDNEISKVILFTIVTYIILSFILFVLFFIVPKFVKPITANRIIGTLPEPLKSYIEIEEIQRVPWSDEMYLVLAKGGGYSFYWSPRGYIVYGDVLIKEDRNFIVYASKAKQEFFERRIKQVDLTKAIKIGNNTKQIVAFINPRCPYCKRGFEFFLKNGVMQNIFFVISNEEDEKLFYSIVCSSDVEETVKQIFYNREKLLAMYEQDIKCTGEKKDLLNYHKKVSEVVFSIPTYLINNKIIIGFDEEKIKEIL